MKIDLFKITKYFAHYIRSLYIYYFLKILLCSNLKVKQKIPFAQWKFDRSINIGGKIIQV